MKVKERDDTNNFVDIIARKDEALAFLEQLRMIVSCGRTIPGDRLTHKISFLIGQCKNPDNMFNRENITFRLPLDLFERNKRAKQLMVETML
jgi:hypothetical protein